MLRRLVVAVVGAALAASCREAATADAPPQTTDVDAGAVAPAGRPKWLDVPGDRLPALPPKLTARTSTFSTSDVCAQCHGPGTDRLRDAKGRDVSPVGTWRASAMALAARDPIYLAALADELQARPTSTRIIEDTCTRCHSPAAHHELGMESKTLSLAALTGEASPTGELAREGVGCTLCHQIESTGLGDPASFSGNFVVGQSREIFGPYQNPLTGPMQTIASYTPTYAPHVGKSALCATCHTVILRTRDASGATRETAEQAPYLEWLASSFAFESTPGPRAANCQDCHMPVTDDDGGGLELAIAQVPRDLAPRKPFWRHVFAGANGQLSRYAASDPTWIGAGVPKEEHEAQARASDAMVRRAAKLELASVVRDAERPGGVTATVVVTNEAGHKFPTAYPTRRAFLHVLVRAPNGDVVFESGRTDEYGRLVTRAGGLLDDGSVFPHLDVVEREDQVQIYEAVLANAAGKPVHRAFDGTRFVKDNRLVPDGFVRRNRFARFTDPVGVDADASWGSKDTVTYRIANVPAGSTVAVRLLFQTTRPSDLEALAETPTPAARKLFDFATKTPPVPVVVAEASSLAP